MHVEIKKNILLAACKLETFVHKIHKGFTEVGFEKTPV
jgi:hypothetical protein